MLNWLLRGSAGRQTVLCIAILLSVDLGLAGTARAETRDCPQQLAFDIFKELVEINTVTATGDTDKAAEAMAARLRAAGFAEPDLQVFTPAPRKGNLVARLRGTGARKPILLLAHLDVVEARRDDWSIGPLQADRAGRLFLRTRHQRRQVHGGGLRGQPDPLQAGGLPARARHHPGAGDGRGDPRRQRAGHPVAAQEPSRPDRRRVRPQRGRRRRAASAASRCATASRPARSTSSTIGWK